MKNHLGYTNFSNDILDLYCKTGCSSIESLYIKFSQNYTQNISKWLLQNKRIRNDLENPAVYDALRALSAIRDKLPEGEVVASNLVKFLGSSPFLLKTVPLILAFKDLLGESQVKDILYPFQDIILMAASTMKIFEQRERDKQITETDLEEVLPSLITIQQAFLSNSSPEEERIRKRKTISQQQKDMFRALLERFSSEMAAAAAASGLKELSQKFSEYILAKPIPMGLGEYVAFPSMGDDKLRLSKQMSDYILKYPDPRMANYNHDIVEINLLRSAGVLSDEDVYRFKENFERKKDVTEYLADDEFLGENFPGIETEGKITINDRMNPEYIYMLSVFFLYMYQGLGLPGSVFWEV